MGILKTKKQEKKYYLTNEAAKRLIQNIADTLEFDLRIADVNLKANKSEYQIGYWAGQKEYISKLYDSIENYLEEEGM